MGGQAWNRSSFRPRLAVPSGKARAVPVFVVRGILKAPQNATLEADRMQKEICVFDRRIVQQSTSGSVRQLLSEVPIPKKYDVPKPPDTIADQTDLQAWKDLFTARRSWTSKVVADCSAMTDKARDRYDEIEVIMKCMDAAVLNFEKHVKQLEQKNADIQSWAADVQQEQNVSGKDWDASMARLQAVPVTYEMIRFMTGRDNRKHQRSYSLQDLFDLETVRRAGKRAQNVSTQLGRQCQDLARRVDEILNKTNRLYDKIETSPAHLAVPRSSESLQLMQDIEAIAKKTSNDYENVMVYSNTPRNVSQASKSALLHTRTFLPNLTKRIQEMDGMLQSATETRNTVAAGSLDIMQGIATLTSMLSSVTGQIGSLELDADTLDAFQLLSTLHSVPATYASFLAEGVRRREWSDKVRSDSSTLANEMAAFQDEETRRRRKWQKSICATLWGDRVESKVMGLEVNLHGEEDEWPPVIRQDLEELLEVLRSKDANTHILTDVSRVISELNNPTKQQSKRAKAFKAGSIHEAALGRSALLLRGDDDLIHTLQEEKVKIETKLMTAESRVRRLEDLLHRQSQLSRTANMFQIQPNPGPEGFHPNTMNSPRPRDDNSRRSSVSSRRFSANQSAEEKAFQQKLLTMEAELIAERERASGLEKEVSSRTTTMQDMKSQLEDLTSTKQDLLQNFEAQQREFAEERRSLEVDIERLKAKLEEVEDELDRYGESRENERIGVDERVRSLQDEMDKLRKSSQAEMQKAQDQVEFLRNDATMHREINDNLRKQLQRAAEEQTELRVRAEKSESLAQEQLKSLTDVHSQLIPNEAAPAKLNALQDALTSKTSDLLSELHSMGNELANIKSDRDRARASVDEVSREAAHTTDKLRIAESETSSLRDTVALEQAKFAALQNELEDERSQLSKVRAQIADGQTGSEAIQSRLEEEERKVTSISEELAGSRTRVKSLEEKLKLLDAKLSSEQIRQGQLTEHLEARQSCAQDLTRRVYNQNDRLIRLLERLGHTVIRESDSMRIEKLPKPDRSQTANDSSDAGTTLRRSISEALTKKSLADSADLSLLDWTNDLSPTAESEKYGAFLNALGRFDTEAFCEAIVRRIKRSRKEANDYREKSRSLHKEAHEKIAYKNFKEGDLALFLPTRNQATGAWAAFNVGAPHYFLREQDNHKLRTRDWLLARIHKIEDRVVDLSKSLHDRRSLGETSNGGDSFEDDNPFDLSDGLRWYLIEAAEEKPGAPSTPGLGKSTVASANIDATGKIERKKAGGGGAEGLGKKLKSLDRRRDSGASKREADPAGLVQKVKEDQDAGKTGATLRQTEETPHQGTADAGPTSGSPAALAQDRNQVNGSDAKPSNTEVRATNIDTLLGP